MPAFFDGKYTHVSPVRPVQDCALGNFIRTSVHVVLNIFYNLSRARVFYGHWIVLCETRFIVADQNGFRFKNAMTFLAIAKNR